MFSAERELQIVLESIQLILAVAIFLLALSAERRTSTAGQSMRLVAVGFFLLAFASALDLAEDVLSTDGITDLWVPSIHQFLTHIVGYVGGGMFLFAGVWRGIKSARQHATSEGTLEQDDGRRLIAANPDAVILHWDGRIEHCNEAAAHICGYRDPVSLVGRAINDFLKPMDQKKVAERIKSLIDGQTRVPAMGLRLIRRDASEVQVEVATTLMTYKNRPVLFSTFRDISLRDEKETQLKRSVQRYKDFAEIGSDWQWEMDQDLRFSYISEKASEAAAVPTAKLLGKRRQDLLSEGSDSTAWAAHLADLDARRPFRNFTYDIVGGTGQVVTVQASGVPVFDSAGNFNGYRGVGNNITEQMKAIKRQKGETDASDRDSQTGLINTTLFLNQLERAMARVRRGDKRLAVLSCDLDDFMAVYDSYGEDYCNRVLIESSHRIRRSLRETDLVARHGQDVFLVLLEDLPQTVGGQVVAEKLLYEMLAPFDRSSGEKVMLGCSIGVSHYGPQDTCTPDNIVDRADKAVQRAKRAGKGTFRVYDPEIDGGDAA